LSRSESAPESLRLPAPRSHARSQSASDPLTSAPSPGTTPATPASVAQESQTLYFLRSSLLPENPSFTAHLRHWRVGNHLFCHRCPVRSVREHCLSQKPHDRFSPLRKHFRCERLKRQQHPPHRRNQKIENIR